MVQASKNGKSLQEVLLPVSTALTSTHFLSCPKGIFYAYPSQYKIHSFLHKRKSNISYTLFWTLPFSLLYLERNCLIAIHKVLLQSFYHAKYFIIWMCQMCSESLLMAFKVVSRILLSQGSNN